MKYRINISIDDVCPYPKMGLDSVFIMRDFLDEFPNIKVTLFVPTAMTRFRESNKTYKILDYPKFIDGLLELPKENFEIGYHGHLHGNKKHNSNNDEFRYISEDGCLEKLDMSKSIFKQADIPVRPIFRPPAFWLSPASFSACNKMGIKVLALHNEKRYTNCYNGKHTKYNHVVYVGNQGDNTGDMEIVYHSSKEAFDCFNKKSKSELKKILTELDGELSFIFMEEFYGQDRQIY